MLLSLSALLISYCNLRFLRLPQRQRIFSSWTQFWTSQVIIRAVYSVSSSAFKMAFSKLSLAKYRCLHIKNHTYFMSSITTERLYKSLFYKFFCTNLSQVVLRRFYTERFLCNWFVSLLFVWSLHFMELIWSFNNRIIHMSMQKVATILQFTHSD